MTDIDHATEARSWLAFSADLNPEVTPERAAHATSLAQVHATLAVADMLAYLANCSQEMDR